MLSPACRGPTTTPGATGPRSAMRIFARHTGWATAAKASSASRRAASGVACGDDHLLVLKGPLPSAGGGEEAQDRRGPAWR